MKTKPSKPTKSRKSKNKKNKKKYKVLNWHEYNQMLVDRGRITFWISEDAQNDWHNVENSGKRGAPCLYSDAAIATCLIFSQKAAHTHKVCPLSLLAEVTRPMNTSRDSFARI